MTNKLLIRTETQQSTTREQRAPRILVVGIIGLLASVAIASPKRPRSCSSAAMSFLRRAAMRSRSPASARRNSFPMGSWTNERPEGSRAHINPSYS